MNSLRIFDNETAHGKKEQQIKCLKNVILLFSRLFIACQNRGGDLHCIHTKKLSRLKSGVEFEMNEIFYEFKYLHHF